MIIFSDSGDPIFNSKHPKKPAVVINRVCLNEVIWAVGSSCICSQYTSGWTRPWAPPLKKNLDPPMQLQSFKNLFSVICQQ